MNEFAIEWIKGGNYAGHKQVVDNITNEVKKIIFRKIIIM